jgi:hypothetical protein
MNPGLYRFFGNNIRPKPGHTYYIEIKRGASKIYHSIPETMPDPVKPDSVYFIIQQEEIVNDFGQPNLKYVIHILIDTPVKSGDRNFYFKWRVDEAYSSTEIIYSPLAYPKTCYIPIEPFSQNIDIYSTESISSGRLDGKKVLSREPQPYFNVSQLSITRECYLYWEKLKIVSNPTGSFLDKIPGAIIGNVYNIHDDKEYVLGYFSVAGEEMARTFTLPGLMNPIYVYPKCLGWDLPDYCYNCLAIENSTLDRPAYWGE